jgi:predicted  nucleic acid-binding Zn ribbon protein
MDIVEISFEFENRRRKAAEDAIASYLAALRQNGQIAGSTSARTRGGFRVFATLPASGALDHRHGSRWVRRALARLHTDGIRAPKVRTIGSDPDEPVACGCHRRPFMVLFTDSLSSSPPVRCGHCFGPVPVYRLPYLESHDSRRELLGWQESYQNLDALWISSGVAEQYAYRQLSDVRSSLSREGRELAKQLETRTGVHVYYYLMKHYGVSDGRDRQRRCPSCKGRWLLPEPLHGILDFQCNRCRLMSNIAFHVRTSPA